MTHKIHEDIWMPIDHERNLDGISVKRHIPALFVIIAKNDLPELLKFHPQRLQLKSATKNANQPVKKLTPDRPRSKKTQR